jgi:hypothetical protein
MRRNNRKGYEYSIDSRLYKARKRLLWWKMGFAIADAVILVFTSIRRANQYPETYCPIAKEARGGMGQKSKSHCGWKSVGRSEATTLATFERHLIRARTDEGRKRAQAHGVRFGRKPKLSAFQISPRSKRSRRDPDGYRPKLRSVALNDFETVMKRAGLHRSKREASPTPPPATAGLLMAATKRIPGKHLRRK